MRFFSIFLLVLFLTGMVQAENPMKFPVLNGPYLGQKPPGDVPALFAPGVVSTGHHEHSAPAFSAEGSEVYWSVFPYFRSPQVILFSKNADGGWTKPEVAPFSGQYSDGSPSISTDGKKLFFVSNRPLTQGGPSKKDFDIWVAERNGNGWGKAENLGSDVNSSNHEASVSVCRNGNLYFTTRCLKDDQSGIAVSRLVKGAYMPPEEIEGLFEKKCMVGWVYVSPEEDFLIYDLYDHPESLGSGDLFISFKKRNGWTEAIHLGKVINTQAQDRFGGLSHDRKYLFFNNNKPLNKGYFQQPMKYREILEIQGNPGNGFADIYWVDARILNKFKPENLN